LREPAFRRVARALKRNAPAPGCVASNKGNPCVLANLYLCDHRNAIASGKEFFMRRVVCSFLVLCTSLQSAAFAACEARTSAGRQHLVELYTSEGCDSCPPAEHWMTTLNKHPDLIGLEFHVDYWDSAQWKDPFSSHSYTQRQEEIAKRGNKAQIFTPQIWLDGHVWQNWPKGAPPSPPDSGPTALTLSIDDGDTVHVRLTADPATESNYRLYAALSEVGLTERIGGGENRGKTLNHDNVVRAFAGPFALPHAEADLKKPSGVNDAKMSVVAFVQDERDGNIVQTLRIPLSECRK
jgi:hypothetical protein